jgi:hypothetical protein
LDLDMEFSTFYNNHKHRFPIRIHDAIVFTATRRYHAQDTRTRINNQVSPAGFILPSSQISQTAKEDSKSGSKQIKPPPNQASAGTTSNQRTFHSVKTTHAIYNNATTAPQSTLRHASRKHDKPKAMHMQRKAETQLAHTQQTPGCILQHLNPSTHSRPHQTPSFAWLDTSIVSYWCMQCKVSEDTMASVTSQCVAVVLALRSCSACVVRLFLSLSLCIGLGIVPWDADKIRLLQFFAMVTLLWLYVR